MPLGENTHHRSPGHRGCTRIQFTDTRLCALGWEWQCRADVGGTLV